MNVGTSVGIAVVGLLEGVNVEGIAVGTKL